MVTLDMPSRHCGGVEIFYWNFLQFVVDENQQHISNVVSFQMAMGDKF